MSINGRTGDFDSVGAGGDFYYYLRKYREDPKEFCMWFIFVPKEAAPFKIGCSLFTKTCRRPGF